MEKIKTNLAKYDNSFYSPGKNILVRFLWYKFNAVLLKGPIPGSSWRRGLLKLFGAKIGIGVVIKPCVNIKYPWNLEIGDYSWIGEKAWIDNLGKVNIGKHCCISQGALLLCGNHNYKKETFDLMVGDITLEDGVWIGARAIVTGNTICLNHSVLTAGSIASKTMESYGIYSGNPAVKIKDRNIEPA